MENHYIFSFRRTLLNLPPIKYITCGFKNSLFLDYNGDVWGAGSNKNGQLGISTQAIVWRPSKINAFNNHRVQKIFSGKKDLSAVILDNGDLYLWGGSDVYEDILTPYKVN
jgi:alpha-tubulin suppressor-like RCC1 family protein